MNLELPLDTDMPWAPGLVGVTRGCPSSCRCSPALRPPGLGTSGVTGTALWGGVTGWQGQGDSQGSPGMTLHSEVSWEDASPLTAGGLRIAGKWAPLVLVVGSAGHPTPGHA